MCMLISNANGSVWRNSHSRRDTYVTDKIDVDSIRARLDAGTSDEIEALGRIACTTVSGGKCMYPDCACSAEFWTKHVRTARTILDGLAALGWKSPSEVADALSTSEQSLSSAMAAVGVLLSLADKRAAELRKLFEVDPCGRYLMEQMEILEELAEEMRNKLPTLASSLIAEREAMKKALEGIATFAWSSLRADCTEAAEEGNKRINACKAALRQSSVEAG